jgi:hypothetical protein
LVTVEVKSEARVAGGLFVAIVLVAASATVRAESKSLISGDLSKDFMRRFGFGEAPPTRGR